MSNEAAASVFTALITDITAKGGNYNAYFTRLGQAYGEAYASQENLLKGVRKNIELAQKAEEEKRGMLLGLVTVAVSGPLAAAISAPLQKWAVQKAAGQTFETAKAALKAAASDQVLGEAVARVDKGLQLAKDMVEKAAGHPAAKQQIEGLQQAIGLKAAGVSEDGYAPPGDPPAVYLAARQADSQERINVLTNAMSGLRDSGLFTEQAARVIATSIRQSDFFSKAPPPKMDPATYQMILKKAKLATWIAWALPRPRGWWEREQIIRSEIHLWTPLLYELIRLGVPMTKIRMDAPQVNVTLTRTEITTTENLNMVGFIDWARSHDAFFRLFSDNVAPEAYQWVSNHWPKYPAPPKS
jgi:hypothetical protein